MAYRRNTGSLEPQEQEIQTASGESLAGRVDSGGSEFVAHPGCCPPTSTLDALTTVMRLRDLNGSSSRKQRPIQLDCIIRWNLVLWSCDEEVI